MAFRYAQPTLTWSRTRTQSPAKAIALVFGSVAFAMVLLLGAMLVSRPANAQELCLLRADAVTQLNGKYKEQVVGRGLVEDGRAMFELFVSESGTWTVVVTDTKGRSCLVGGGEGWTRLPLLVGDPA